MTPKETMMAKKVKTKAAPALPIPADDTEAREAIRAPRSITVTFAPKRRYIWANSKAI